MLDFRRKDPHIGGDFKGLPKSVNPNGSGNVIVNKSQRMSTYSDIPIKNSLFLSHEELIKLKNEYPPGTRVKLLQMDDPQAPPIGCLGTVTGVDDTGSLLMKWDNGSGLNVIYKVDKVKKIKGSNV